MSATQAMPGLLNSWKEIATYLGRGVRTVQRWEEIGLPVRRLGKGVRSPVLAHAGDIDIWLQQSEVSKIGTPQAVAYRSGSLRDSIEQSHLLRKEMETLRDDGMKSLQTLIGSIISLQKSCGTRASVRSDAGWRSSADHLGGKTNFA